MGRFVEQRGKYQVAYYTVDISSEMRQLALEFATKIILTDNQYSRLLPDEIKHSNNIVMQQKIEIQRTYMGKLGELSFARFLRERNKSFSEDGMLKIFEGQQNVDDFDFQTFSGKQVDVKTGFRKIHQRLLVNVEQFDNIPKDIYVAVRLNANDINPKMKLVDWNDITLATIIGYAEHKFMKKKAEIKDFGEGDARWLYYKQLMGIDKLLNMF